MNLRYDRVYITINPDGTEITLLKVEPAFILDLRPHKSSSIYILKEGAEWLKVDNEYFEGLKFSIIGNYKEKVFADDIV